MGKKYKMKSVANQKKAAPKGVPEIASKEPETAKAKESEVVHSKCIVPKDNPNPSMVDTKEADKHLEQVAAIAIMPLRLDQHIQGIKAIQKQLLALHQQQVIILDECTNLLQELNAIKPRNDLEVKLVLDTFVEIKDKLSDVFGHFLPAQLDILKQVLGKPNDIKPK